MTSVLRHSIRADASTAFPVDVALVATPVSAAGALDDSSVGRGGDDAARAGFVAAVIELTKPRITRLVTITAGVGFALAAVAGGAGGVGSWSVGRLATALIGCLIGTALSSAGANALNQWMERSRDALMPRTRHRPLPEGRLSPAVSLLTGVLLCWLGVMVLLLLAGPAPAAVSLATILLYTLIYTPLKPVTGWATIIGAVPGALPPVIGWASATADPIQSNPLLPLLSAGGWSLFALMFVWQLPHFWAIAWMYRDDYALGGYKVLSVTDKSGFATRAAVLLSSIVLLPATLAPVWAIGGGLGVVSLAVAIATGLAFIGLCVRFAVVGGRDAARVVFFASIIHLPLLLMVMTADALASAVLG